MRSRLERSALGEIAVWTDAQVAAFFARRDKLEEEGLGRRAASIEAFRQVSAEIGHSRGPGVERQGRPK